MEVLIYAVIGLLNIVCFVVGAKVGQSIVKGKDVELPNLNPLQAIRENRAKREADKEQSKNDAILRNIDRYDGTSQGQEDV